jgi:hypothetical protein
MPFQGTASGYKYSMLNLKGGKQLLFERQMQKEEIKLRMSLSEEYQRNLCLKAISHTIPVASHRNHD